MAPDIRWITAPQDSERDATPVRDRTPIVLHEHGRWLPGEVLAWWQPAPGRWAAQIRARADSGVADRAGWVAYDPAAILPVFIHGDDCDWWLPPARNWREPLGTPGPR